MIQQLRTRLRQAARWTRRRFQAAALILLYHRIAAVQPDPWSLCVTPQHFAEHLHLLRRQGTVMRLDHLLQRLREGQLPPRAIALTFDDGYADNLSQARPLLEQNDIPATVFVVSGALGQAQEFWWDELARILLEPGTLPGALALRVGDTAAHWDLGQSTIYTEKDAHRDRQWVAWRDEHPTPRHELYRALWERLLPLPEGERQLILAELRAWAGVKAQSRPTHRALRPGEVADLARDGLVDIGAHTVTHPRLAALSLAEQQAEIQGSQAALEDVVGKPVQSFSYPFGRQSDYAAETVRLVREQGFGYACSNFADWVTRTTDPFQLPRVNVPDCDGETLARYLADEFGLS